MNPSKSAFVRRGDPPVGLAPSVVLCDPRFGHNVGMVVRLASCYGLKQVWYTGDRVSLDLEKRRRLPREERMKGYRSVEMVNYDRPLELFSSEAVPVAVEVRKSSERLQDFEHPKNAVYVFGPEDGSIPGGVLRLCHRFVVIPTRGHNCLNLATACATVLWDRAVKLGEVPEESEEDEKESFADTDAGAIGVRGTEGSWP